MKPPNTAQRAQMHEYNSPRERVGIKTYCETCEKTMNTVDWPQHERGKKHEDALKKLHKAENNALTAESLATSWGDEANEAAANDSAAANGHDKPTSDRACRNCRQEGHFAKECTEPRSGGGGRACHNCGSTDHLARECPEPRSAAAGAAGGRACHNCGSTDHLARECPERSAPTCHKCNQPGHISKDCHLMKCDNCDAEDHVWKQCQLRKNWAKIMANWTCKNCNQKGHSNKKCPNPTVGGSGFDGDSSIGGFGKTTGFDNPGFDAAVVADDAAAPGSWDGADAPRGWDSTPAADDGAGMW